MIPLVTECICNCIMYVCYVSMCDINCSLCVLDYHKFHLKEMKTQYLPHIYHQFLISIILFSVSVAKISNDQWQENAVTDFSSALEPFLPHYLIIVDPDNENAVDGKACHPPVGGGNSSVPCQSLDYAFQAFHSLKSVMFYLASASDTYHVNFSLNVIDQYNIGFYGNDDLYPIVPTVECKQDVGLSFVNSTNIVVHNINFLHCGTMQNSTSKDFPNSEPNATQFLTIRVGLYFYNCTNVKLYHVQVSNSSQAIGVVIYDTDGVVEVKSCIFANNRASDDGSQAGGGGGVTVEFTYCKPGDSTCNKTTYDSDFKRNSNSVYLFDNCTFKENIAHNVMANGNYIMPSRSDHDASGRGGGLSVYFKGDAVNNSISITDSHFINNDALWGGGLRIEMNDNTINNTASLLRCVFAQNHAVSAKNGKYTGGGGIHIVTATHYWNDVYKSKQNSRIQIKDCSINYNQALEGGGICFALARQDKISTDQVIDISVSNSFFEFNQARLGSAVLVINFPIFNDGILSKVKFYNCTFSNNHFILASEALHPAGIAAAYISEVSTSFQNNTTFYNNTGTALVVVGSQVDFSGSVALFENNRGSDGGAIALLGISSILIGPNTHMTFVNNTASRYGGAIYNRYISNEDLKSNGDCFLRYSQPTVDPAMWEVWFNFSGNEAGLGGCSIYSSSVYPCLWSERYVVDISTVFHWNNEYWHYENRKCEHEIYTEPNNFSLHNQSLTDPVQFFPGHTFRLPLEAWDDFEHNVTKDAVYSASVLDSLPQSNSVAEVDPGFTYITSNYIKITGEPGNNISLVMQTEGSRTVHVVLKLTILMCPPGFVLSQGAYNYNPVNIKSILLGASAKKSKCDCPADRKRYRANLKCYFEQFKSKIDVNYWYGPVNIKESGDEPSTPYLMGFAPFAYRFTSRDMEFLLNTTSIELPSNRDEVEETLCGNVSRRGVLCLSLIHI